MDRFVAGGAVKVELTGMDHDSGVNRNWEYI
jgi:hypothetical protein